MPSRIVPPKYGTESFNCPRCGAFAAQQFDELLSRGTGGLRGMGDPAYMDVGPEGIRQRAPIWRRSCCYSCNKSCLWIEGKLAFPDPSTLLSEIPDPNEDLPALVAELYREAAAVMPHSKRAAAALCRAAMEQLAKNFTPELKPGTKLDERLAELSKTVSTGTVKALTIVRHVGNTALHGERDDDSSAVIYLHEDDRSIADVFFMAINALADEKITRAKTVDSLYSALPEGVRKSFEGKMHS